jgi:hypothetical protein
MKIKLTDEQRLQMDSIWAAMDALQKDKQFMKLMKHCCDANFNDEKVTTENEDDYSRIVNFYDDLIDRADSFNLFTYPVKEDPNCF